MSTQQMIYLGIVFVIVFGVAMFVLSQLAPNRVKERLRKVVTPPSRLDKAEESVWVERVTRIAEPLAGLSLPEEGWDKSSLRVRFIHAGFNAQSPLTLFFGAKTFLVFALPALAALALAVSGKELAGATFLLIMLIVATIGYYLPNAVLARLVENRQREIFDTFPDAIDLLLVCIEAGLGLDAALSRIADEIALKSKALSSELHLITLELRAGNSREKALKNFALRTGVPEVETLVTMLVQADRFGTSIGDSLRVLSEELRNKRRLRAEEAAAKIPLKLLFPLIFFLFPTLFIVLLGPAALQIARVLLPTMSGGGQ